MFSNEVIFFITFLIFIFIVLFIDLGIFDKHSHKISLKEALVWTIIWVSLSFAFYFFLRIKGNLLHGIDSLEELNVKIKENSHLINISGLSLDEAIKVYNKNLSLEYITGYLIEYTLSIDNIFVILMIFISFNVNEKHYKRVLFWGILGAIIFRFIFIFISSALIHKFDWMFYVFGAILLFSGIKMFLERNKQEKVNVQNHPVVKFTSKYFNIFPRFVGEHFFIKKGKKIMLTPLALVLIIIEFSDVIFAVDSVPAIFSVTKDPYIVFFSNIFAILGLRSLFFLIVHVINLFRFLKIGISFLLIFIGFKLIFHSWLKTIGFSTEYSLYIVSTILFGSIILSIIFPKRV